MANTATRRRRSDPRREVEPSDGGDRGLFGPDSKDEVRAAPATFLSLGAEALEKASAAGEIAEVTGDGENGKQI